MKSKLRTLFRTLRLKLRVRGYDVRIGGIYYKLDAIHSVAEVVAGSKEYCDRIIVPAAVEHEGRNYRVAAVGDGAFCRSSSLVFVILSPGIARIGKAAFQGCAALLSVTLPEGLKMIGDGAFAGCSALKQVILPDTLTYLGAAVFRDCFRLRALILPAGIETIENKCFIGCTSLKQIVIPAGVKQVGEMAFFRCASLKTIVAMPPVAPDVSGPSVFGRLSPRVSLHYPVGCDYTAWSSYFGDMKTFVL